MTRLHTRQIFGVGIAALRTTLTAALLALLFPAAAILARYGYHLAGSWRWIYVIGSVLALYLNVFVLVVQSFLKIPDLNRLAPTQTEPPFLIAQLLVVALFVFLGVLAVRRFHPAPARPV
jgi:MFS family permease